MSAPGLPDDMDPSIATFHMLTERLSSLELELQRSTAHAEFIEWQKEGLPLDTRFLGYPFSIKQRTGVATSPFWPHVFHFATSRDPLGTSPLGALYAEVYDADTLKRIMADEGEEERPCQEFLITSQHHNIKEDAYERKMRKLLDTTLFQRVDVLWADYPEFALVPADGMKLTPRQFMNEALRLFKACYGDDISDVHISVCPVVCLDLHRVKEELKYNPDCEDLVFEHESLVRDVTAVGVIDLHAFGWLGVI